MTLNVMPKGPDSNPGEAMEVGGWVAQLDCRLPAAPKNAGVKPPHLTVTSASLISRSMMPNSAWRDRGIAPQAALVVAGMESKMMA
ncbi:hypothetical protein TNCV_4432651 [Trichonephila clavipes]|nr:hypothetical protein TNCV_4432651 [Trichonephila clavipes]